MNLKESVLAEEEKATKIADTYAKREKEYYKNALKRIENEIYAIYAELRDKGVESLTRTQFYQLTNYTNLYNAISQEVYGIGNFQIKQVSESIADVLNITVPRNKNPLRFKQMLAQLVDSTWSGETFSNRIWANTDKLAKRMQDTMTDMIVLGKDSRAVKQELVKEFGVSYSSADRLIRTETSRAYNESALMKYTQAGIEKVEILVESDACEECLGYKGKEFLVNVAPKIPAHPNCRCCYSPIL